MRGEPGCGPHHVNDVQSPLEARRSEPANVTGCGRALSAAIVLLNTDAEHRTLNYPKKSWPERRVGVTLLPPGGPPGGRANVARLLDAAKTELWPDFGAEREFTHVEGKPAVTMIAWIGWGGFAHSDLPNEAGIRVARPTLACVRVDNVDVARCS